MLHRSRCMTWTLISAMSVGGIGLTTGCENLPGDEKSQGAVIGGVTGAAAGALIGGKENRLLGALIGGAAGAGGGYLIGANWDKITGKKSEEAQEAQRRAEDHPATARDVDRSDTADLNKDGFVTLDEVVAMDQSGLSDSDMIRRLERTNQYFELTREQEQYLSERGVDRDVIVAMRDMRPDEPRTASDRLSHDDDVRTDPIGTRDGDR